jgi:hypothetical protein
MWSSHESPQMRWDRLGIQYNVLATKEDGLWINTCKKGNLSWKRAHFYPNPQTPVNTCDVCGRLGTPRRVCWRNDVYKWNVLDPKDYKTPSKTMLCMGCWNKVRRICDREREAREAQRLINLLKKEMGKWQRSQQQAN